MGCGSSVNDLSKSDLELLKKKTNFSTENIQRWHKVFKKECPSGNLTRKKFVGVYSHMFPNGNSADFFDHMFRTFDKDKSNSLSFVEFMLAIYTTEAGSPEEILQLSFELYDIDSNGQIEIHEIAEILLALHQLRGANKEQIGNLCEVQAKELMAVMDVNHDNVLSKDEFLKGCMKDNDIRKLLTSGGTKK